MMSTFTSSLDCDTWLHLIIPDIVILSNFGLDYAKVPRHYRLTLVIAIRQHSSN